MKKIRVLVIDDSAIVRDILSRQLSAYPEIEVTDSAGDPYIARNKIETTEFDVLTLDIEMPRMDGLTFLKYLMKYNPLPVIIVSSIASGNNQAAIEALELGAVDVVQKPGGPFSVEEVTEELAEKIVEASIVPRSRLLIASEKLKKRNKTIARKTLSKIATTKRLVVVGASTGGTIALEELFTRFTPDFPPTLAVIHMPPRFTASFANRLDGLCIPHVKEAEDGELVMPGTIYIAPGGYHMLVGTSGTDRIIRIKNGPKLFGQRPAVDVLFNSAADNIGRNCTAAILTGMGRDGAAGMKAIRDAGGYTIAQDEESCIVFGMPKEAITLGGACEITPLSGIAASIGRHSR
ncbi:MAG: chemotaxis response regulator protein-glutamate methylesterase [Treponema sp.]|nr:chemotaxis response regulator protein-glutamate methylesterase [Treponema sp.]